MSPAEKREAMAAARNLFHDVDIQTISEELDIKRRIYITTRGQSSDGAHELTIKITFEWTEDKTLKLITPVEFVSR